MRKHLLVIGGNDSSSVKASQLDVDVTLFQLKSLLTANQLKSVDRLFLFDFEDLEATVSFARALHGRYPFHAVVSFWERGLLPAAVLGEAIGVPTNALNAVRVTRDKFALRALLAEDSELSVAFRRCSTPSEVTDFLRLVQRPVVLKPTHGSGSAGVSVVSTETEVNAAWDWALRTGLTGLMTEEYVSGPEFSVESLTLDGNHTILGVTEKETTGAPHFIETGHRFPANLPQSLVKRISGMIIRLLEKIGHTQGPAHSEVRVVGDRPVLIETQTRFGGDQIWEMVELVTGVDLTKTTCSHLLGLRLPPVCPSFGGAAIRFFALENCNVQSISGLEYASSLPGIVRVECKLRAGDCLGPLVASRARQGYVLAVSDSSESAWNIAEEALQHIKVDVRPIAISG